MVRRIHCASDLLMALIIAVLGLHYAMGLDVPNIQPRHNDPNPPRRVHLVLADSPQFDALVQEHFPDLAASGQGKTSEATSVFVANGTGFSIEAGDRSIPCKRHLYGLGSTISQCRFDHILTGC
jgi:hypothetical protein